MIIANNVGYDRTITLPFIPQIGSKLSLGDVIEDVEIDQVYLDLDLTGSFKHGISLESINYKDAQKDLLSIGFTVI
jgi:hypothetical protein